MSYPRYASFSPNQCDREALKLCQHAVASGKWQEITDQLVELRRIRSFSRIPAEHLHFDQQRVIWNKGQTPAEEIAALE